MVNQSQMMCKATFLTVFFLMCTVSLWSQKKKQDPVTYSLKYVEEIRSAYRNLLQKSDSSDFKKYINSWKITIVLQPANEAENLKLSIRKEADAIQNPENPSLSGFQTIEIKIKKSPNHPDEICYPSYPGRETDLLIKNIVANVPDFHFKKLPDNAFENYPDGSFKVNYKQDPFKGNEKQTIVHKEKLSLRNNDEELSRIIIDSFSSTIKYDKENLLLNSFIQTEFKHQKIGREVLAYIENTYHFTSRTSRVPG